MMTERIDRLSLAALYSLGWFPVAVFALYLKYYEIAERYAQLLFVNSQIENPSLVDYLFLFKSDIFYNFFVIPLILVVLGYCLRRNGIWLLTAAAVLSFIVLVILYANLHSWGTVGRFLTWTSVVDAVTFAWQSPSYISMYVDLDSIVKFMLLSASVVALYAGVRHVWRYRFLARLASFATGAVLLLALVLASVGKASQMQNLPITSNFIYQALGSLFDSHWDPEYLSRDLRGGELQAMFARLSDTQSEDKVQQYFGVARDADVIVFIMETGSSRFMDLRDDLESFPVLSRLAKNSLIAANHYSSFPATSEALFSLFNSVYPPRNYYSSCVNSRDVNLHEPLPGFLAELADSGYVTSLYLPYNDIVPLDHILHQNQDFSKIYFAQSQQNLGKGMDVQALDAMKADISGWLANDQRYVAVFLPQIGHAPWPSRPDTVSIREYGKRMARKQDEWIGQLVDLVERSGRLDNTIILVAGDHGIRTAREDPQFNTGFLDEYSFRVPLLLFSKTAFAQPIYIETLTSHIDVSPTMLDLHGINRDRSIEQGLALWDPGIKQRTTFFMGNWYLGADGYHKDGVFRMHSEVLGSSFENDELEFDAQHIIEEHEENMAVRDITRQIYAVQQEWLRRYICEIDG